MLRLLNITKIYNNKYDKHLALDDISLEFKDNKGLVFLLGPSGSGKSTILNIIADVDKDYQGKREISGNLVYVYQGFKLFENMTLLDNLLIIDNDLEKINHYIKELNLEELKNKKVYKLSNGQKKRLEFIKAILLNPDILLCDEITSALDFENCNLVMKLLCELSKKMLVIMVTHDESLVLNYKDSRVIRLENAKMISDVDNINYNKQIEYKKTNLYKNLKDHLVFVQKEFKSRFLYFLTMILILVLSISAIYTSFNLYQTIKTQNNLKNTYKYGRNIVDSFIPKKKGFNLAQRSIENDIYSTYYYDIYKPKDIKEFIKENKNIIAVETSFSPIKNECFRILPNSYLIDDGKSYFRNDIGEDYFSMGSLHDDERSIKDIPSVFETIGAFKNIYFNIDDHIYDDDSYYTIKAIWDNKKVVEFISSFNIEYNNMFKDDKELGIFGGGNYTLFPKKNRTLSRNVINIHPHALPFILLNEKDLIKRKTFNPHYTYDYDISGKVRDLYDDFSLHFYHILDRNIDLNILYGNMPKKDDEIVLDVNASKAYAKYLGIDEKDLIGKEIDIAIYANSVINTQLKDDEVIGVETYKSYIEDQFNINFEDLWIEKFQFTISGISSFEIMDKRVAFTMTPFDKNVFIDRFTTQYTSDEYNEFHSKNNYFNYPFFYEGSEVPKDQIGSIYFDTVSFILEPGSDYDGTVKNANAYFKPEFDNFLANDENSNNENSFYKSATVFYPFLVLTTFIIIAIPFIVIIFNRKRDKKENNLLQNYGYKLSLVYLIKLFLYFVSAMVLACISIYIFTSFINKYALNYNYVSFLNFDFMIIMFISLFVVLITLIYKMVVSK